jgi:hypothetical protein
MQPVELKVAVTRRALAQVRQAMLDSSPSAPFNPTRLIDAEELPGVTFEMFTLSYVQGNAVKRKKKHHRQP